LNRVKIGGFARYFICVGSECLPCIVRAGAVVVKGGGGRQVVVLDVAGFQSQRLIARTIYWKKRLPQFQFRRTLLEILV